MVVLLALQMAEWKAEQKVGQTAALSAMMMVDPSADRLVAYWAQKMAVP